MIQLYDGAGKRKYITPAERRRFLETAEDSEPAVRTFCETLALTGCRISEALALTGARIDTDARLLVFESLKKRRRGIYRALPVPASFIARLEAVHHLDAATNRRLWTWSRTTAWRRVREVMEAAGLRGRFATPKGVRHGFGVQAVTSNVPLNLTQKWLGHSRIATTAIYADATGPEEQEIAARMWPEAERDRMHRSTARRRNT